MKTACPAFARSPPLAATKLQTMGMFLAVSGILGRSAEMVHAAIGKYAESKNLTMHLGDPNASEGIGTIAEFSGNCSVLYPSEFVDWDEISMFLSANLNTSVFSFHIHDGDLWMYTLYVAGAQVDQFNPIPDYWEGISDEAAKEWSGDADVIAKYWTNINQTAIIRYLTRWDLDREDGKAYSDDVFERSDWQLVDFMKRLNLPWPMEDEDNVLEKSIVFELVEIEDYSSKEATASVSQERGVKKPWWKFW